MQCPLLAGCITGGIATIAAARKIELTKVESTVTGEIDVRGVLGIDDGVRRGFGAVSATFVVEGDASDEDLQKLVADSVRLSAVYDMLSASVPVTVSAA
ncbi:MAG: OsmC family protein [Actinomycetota bacterium]